MYFDKVAPAAQCSASVSPLGILGARQLQVMQWNKPRISKIREIKECGSCV